MAWMIALQRRNSTVYTSTDYIVPTYESRTRYQQRKRSRRKRRTGRAGTYVQRGKIPNIEHHSSLTNLKASTGYSTSTRPTSLTTSLEQQPKSENGVPIIVEACLRYFNNNATASVGLFRVPGCERHVQEMWDYMQYHPGARQSISCVNAFMRKHPDFTADDVASFLKRFIQSIVGNEPVITYNCYAPLVELASPMCPAHLIGEKARRIVHQLLVPARRALLGRLCNFLKEFSRHEPKTTMDRDSLSLCFGYLMQVPPEYLSVNKQSKRKSSSKQSLLRAEHIHQSALEKTELCASVIGLLVQYSHHVFIPCLSSARPPRSSSKNKSTRRRPRRRKSSEQTRLKPTQSQFNKKLSPAQLLRSRQSRAIQAERFMRSVKNNMHLFAEFADILE